MNEHPITKSVREAKADAWDGVIAFLVDHPEGHGLLHCIIELDRAMDPDDPIGKDEPIVKDEKPAQPSWLSTVTASSFEGSRGDGPLRTVIHRGRTVDPDEPKGTP